MKIGDWVKFISNKPNDYCDGEILQITNIDDRGFCHFGDYNKLYSIDLLELWQPKEGEWCWMFSDGNLSPHIMQFSCMGLDGKTYLSGFAGYDKCEPFIGELPSFIKDKQ